MSEWLWQGSVCTRIDIIIVDISVSLPRCMRAAPKSQARTILSSLLTRTLASHLLLLFLVNIYLVVVAAWAHAGALYGLDSRFIAHDSLAECVLWSSEYSARARGTKKTPYMDTLIFYLIRDRRKNPTGRLAFIHYPHSHVNVRCARGQRRFNISYIRGTFDAAKMLEL